MSGVAGTGLVVAVLALTLSLGGCARHVHHHHAKPKPVVVLDQEHSDKTIVIVKSPQAKRNCWKHRGHWHCRVR